MTIVSVEIERRANDGGRKTITIRYLSNKGRIYRQHVVMVPLDADEAALLAQKRDRFAAWHARSELRSLARSVARGENPRSLVGQDPVEPGQLRAVLRGFLFGDLSRLTHAASWLSTTWTDQQLDILVGSAVRAGVRARERLILANPAALGADAEARRRVREGALE